jgi:arsenite oxidase small subunit
VAAVGAAAATIATREAKAAPPSARINYPSNRLANVSDLKVNFEQTTPFPSQAPSITGSVNADGYCGEW